MNKSHIRIDGGDDCDFFLAIRAFYKLDFWISFRHVTTDVAAQRKKWQVAGPSNIAAYHPEV